MTRRSKSRSIIAVRKLPISRVSMPRMSSSTKKTYLRNCTTTSLLLETDQCHSLRLSGSTLTIQQKRFVCITLDSKPLMPDVGVCFKTSGSSAKPASRERLRRRLFRHVHQQRTRLSLDLKQSNILGPDPIGQLYNVRCSTRSRHHQPTKSLFCNGSFL